MGILDKLFGLPPNELKAAQFFEYGSSFSSHMRKSLRGHSDLLDDAIQTPEFIFFAFVVALAAADCEAIIKYGSGSPKSKKILGLMIKSAEIKNPHIRKNLIFHKGFIDAMEDEGRLHKDGLSITQASGCWILMALGNQNTIDFDDSEILMAGKILGETIYERFRGCWDESEVSPAPAAMPSSAKTIWKDQARQALLAGNIQDGPWQRMLQRHLERLFPALVSELQEAGDYQAYLLVQTSSARDLYLKLLDRGSHPEDARELALEQLLPKPPDEEDHPEEWETEDGMDDMTQAAKQFLTRKPQP